MKPSNPSLTNIDRQILELLDQRCQAVEQSLPADWSSHLDAIEQVLASSDAHRLDTETRRSILRHVASSCFNANRPLSAAYLGPEDSYSHLAVLKYFGESIHAVPVATIAAVFDAVERGQCDRGIVPIENSTDGRIVDTLGRLIDDRVHLVGEVLVPIHHYLLASVERHQIEEVHSKPQAISQCRNWLANHLPHAKLVESASTADAAKLASTTLGIAAIASEQAGRRFGLQVIAPQWHSLWRKC
jgi:chorismate mutase / prephenate dehydratase